MKIWVIKDEDHGETYLFDGSRPVYEDTYVATELSYLVGGYDDEREAFIADVDAAMRRGRGEARIEERLSVSLKEKP